AQSRPSVTRFDAPRGLVESKRTNGTLPAPGRHICVPGAPPVTVVNTAPSRANTLAIVPGGSNDGRMDVSVSESQLRTNTPLLQRTMCSSETRHDEAFAPLKCTTLGASRDPSGQTSAPS